MKKTLSLLTCLVTLFAAVGCGSGTASSSSADISSSQVSTVSSELPELSDSSASTVSEAAEAGKHTITDINGDSVTVSREINRVVSRSGNGTSFLVAMGLGDKLVGTADYVVTNPWVERFYNGISALPQFKWTPNNEEIIALNADLVMFPDPEVCESLRNDGVPAVCYKQYNEQEIVASANLLGELFGESAKTYTDKWLEYYNETEKYISEKISTVQEEDRPGVYYIYGQSNKGLGRTAGGGSINEVMIEGAGGRFLTSDLSNDGPTITEEEAISRNPDVIMIGGIYGSDLQDELEGKPEWSGVKAVKDQKIFRIPVGFISWDFYGVEYPLLKLWIAKQLYPELIDKDMHEETKSFHKDFYGIELTDDEVDHILNGLDPNGEKYAH